jgi:hypothetical protein
MIYNLPYPDLITKINEVADTLNRLSIALKRNPSEIMITDGPKPLCNFPAFKHPKDVFKWYDIPEKEDICGLIQALHKEKLKDQQP